MAVHPNDGPAYIKKKKKMKFKLVEFDMLLNYSNQSGRSANRLYGGSNAKTISPVVADKKKTRPYTYKLYFLICL